MKKEAKTKIILTLSAIIFIALIYFIVPPTFITFTILEGYIWNTTDSSKFIYNASEIEIENVVIKLKQQNITIQSTTEKKITAYVSSAIRYSDEDQEDATEEVQTLDGNITNVDKSQIFDVSLNETLNNNDAINLYLMGITAGQEIDIYLCQNSTQCTSPGYGLTYYDGTEKWINIIITNLTSPSTSFNIDPPLKVKVDYINATKIVTEENSITSLGYMSMANISTQDLIVENLQAWDLLITEETLNNQSISYEYSADSGLNWVAVPQNKNLSSINSNKIRIKAILNSDTVTSPEISLINITYIEQTANKTDATYYETNSSNRSITITLSQNKNITINDTDLKTELILEPNSNDNIEISITLPENIKEFSLKRIKELDISSPQLQDKIQSASLRIYYTDEEIKNIEESTLKLYYYNETSQQWQQLDSKVNTEQNYVEATLQHFSIYALFGEDNSESESGSGGSSSSGGSGGGGSSSRTGSAPNIGNEQTSAEEKNIQQQKQQGQQQVESTEQEVIQTETQQQEQTTLTGFITRTGKVLSSGKVNQSLIILAAILIVSYIIVRIEESKATRTKKTHKKLKKSKHPAAKRKHKIKYRAHKHKTKRYKSKTKRQN